MTYSCTDFTDTILDALRIEVPEEFEDSPSDQADLALAEIQRLRVFERGTPERRALAHLREAHRLLKDAPRARERVRLAITSTGGAIRNADNKSAADIAKLGKGLASIMHGPTCPCINCT